MPWIQGFEGRDKDEVEGLTCGEGSNMEAKSGN
jgi:hypothetical protein